MSVTVVTTSTLQKMKQQGEKIACLTAYDYSFSVLLDKAGMDIILIGDSLGMVMQGHETPLPVTLEDCAYHTSCVARGAERAMLMGDLPFGTFQLSKEQAFESAVKLMQAGANIIKLEGGKPMAETIEFMVQRGVPVCAHIGLTPQSVHQFGGFKVQGRGEAAKQVLQDAKIVQESGASAIVLEAMPEHLATQISQQLTIPTIGIGAGANCDGQVLVLQDMLGLYPHKSPKFCKNFMQEAASVSEAIELYVAEVKAGKFPAKEHSFS